jgi:hypothetical protein
VTGSNRPSISKSVSLVRADRLLVATRGDGANDLSELSEVDFAIFSPQLDGRGGWLSSNDEHDLRRRIGQDQYRTGSRSHGTHLDPRSTHGGNLTNGYGDVTIGDQLTEDALDDITGVGICGSGSDDSAV